MLNFRIITHAFINCPIPAAAAVAALLTICSCSGGFTAAERAVISPGEDGMMRVLTTADRGDSLTLRKKSAPLSARMLKSAEYAALRRRMLETVRDPENTGVGIAAPQVGIRRRLIAVQRFDKPGEPFEFYVNPSIVHYSAERTPGREGCLSIPDRYGIVERSQRIVLRYRDERFEEKTDTINGFTAVIFQHETDHLDGTLYIDRLMP